MESFYVEVALPSAHSVFVVPLDRKGNPANLPATGDGTPRTIDLRAGDQIRWHKVWRPVVRLAVCRERWLTEAEAATCTESGYLSRRPRGAKASQ